MACASKEETIDGVIFPIRAIFTYTGNGNMPRVLDASLLAHCAPLPLSPFPLESARPSNRVYRGRTLPADITSLPYLK